MMKTPLSGFKEALGELQEGIARLQCEVGACETCAHLDTCASQEFWDQAVGLVQRLRILTQLLTLLAHSCRHVSSGRFADLKLDWTEPPDDLLIKQDTPP